MSVSIDSAGAVLDESELYADSCDPVILIGDVREKIMLLPDESVDVIVTSPPYWKQRDYGEDGQLGQEDVVESYIEEMVEIVGEFRRVLKDSGVFFLNIGDKYVDKHKEMIPYRVAHRLRDQGWACRNIISWYKTNHMPSALTDRFTNTWEPIFMFVKDDPEYYLNPRYEFDIDSVRVPHKTEGSELPAPREVLSAEEIEVLPESFVRSSTLPYTVSESVYERLPERFRVEGNDEYDGKFVNEQEINTGQSPGARMSVDGVYYSQQRKYDPDGEEVVKYLRSHKKASGLTISEIDDHFGYSHTAGHWFRTDEGGRSLPSPEDWVELKNLFGFDNTFDAEMTEMQYVLQGVRRHPDGKNPGDMWEISTASYSDAHFAVFPEEIPRRCITVACPEEGLVLDPFAGSGTTGKVAKELGRQSVLIDLNPEYESLMRARCGMPDSQE